MGNCSFPASLLFVYFAVWMLDSCLAGCSSLSWLILGGLLMKESNLLSFQSCVSCAWTLCFTAAVDDGENKELLFVLFGLFLLPQNHTEFKVTRVIV